MKYLLGLLSLALAENSVTQLQKENEKLRIANSILHKQLLSFAHLSDLTSHITEDYSSNKQILNQLLTQLASEIQPELRISLSEEVLHYLKVLSEDLNLLGGVAEGTEDSTLQKAIQEFEDYLNNLKQAQIDTEHSKTFYEFKKSLNAKEQNIRNLQLENSKLIGKLDYSEATIQDMKQRLQDLKKTSDQKTLELNNAKTQQESWISQMRESIQSEEQLIRTKEAEEFKHIQDSQDQFILELQQQSADQKALIEQLSLEKNNLSVRLKYLNNTVERLQKELDARNTQLSFAQKQFEEFRNKVETDSSNEIAFLQNSETQMREEINSLQNKELELLQNLANCTQDSDQLSFLNKQKENKLKELNLQLKEAQRNIELAKASKEEEVQKLLTQIQDLKQQIEYTQKQLDEALENLSTQSNQKPKSNPEPSSPYQNFREFSGFRDYIPLIS